MPTPNVSRQAVRSCIGRPSAVRAADLERHVLATAWDLFMQHGFAGVTVEAIAVQGRLSKRTIYSRFESKEVLFAAALASHIAEWESDLAEPVSKSDFRTWVHAFAGRVLAISLSDQVIALERLAMSEGGRFPQLLRMKEDAYLRAVTMLTNVILDEKARGTVHVADVSFAGRCWFDMLLGHARANYILRDKAFDVEQHIATWLDRLVDVLLLIVRFEPEGSQTKPV